MTMLCRSFGVKGRWNAPNLSGHYSRDWMECVNVIGMISEPFAVNRRK